MITASFFDVENLQDYSLLLMGLFGKSKKKQAAAEAAAAQANAPANATPAAPAAEAAPQGGDMFS